VFVATTVAQTV